MILRALLHIARLLLSHASMTSFMQIWYFQKVSTSTRLYAPSSAQVCGAEDGGCLAQGFARSASFDSLATKFLTAAADAKSAVMDEVTSAGGSLVDDAKTNAELYGRYMKKAVEKVGSTRAGS